MVLTEKQFKKINAVLSKTKPFKMQLGYELKNWLETLESETMFLGCVNLRKACLYAALDTAGRTWWNSIPDIAHMGYAELKEHFIQRLCPDTILQPHLQAYMKQRQQRSKESVQEFSECFLVLLEQLNPRPTEQAAISLFEDKLHKEISAALAGDRFDSLQEAIDKAQTVEEKLLRREVTNPSHF